MASIRLPHYLSVSPEIAFQQCELLEGIWEHRPIAPPTELAENAQVPIKSVYHPSAFIMNAACDLEQDFEKRTSARQAERSSGTDQDEIRRGEDEPYTDLIPHIMLCDAYPHSEIRSRVKGKDLWKPIDTNQALRFHHFEPATVQGGHEVDGLYIDFAKTFAITTAQLYEAVNGGHVRRIGVVPDVYSHDLVQRFHAYHSRVGPA